MSRLVRSSRARVNRLVLFAIFSLIAVSAVFVAQRVFADTGTGSVSLTTTGTAAIENFITLSNTAASTTNTTLPTGWYITETGGGARDNEQYAVDTGGSNTGDTYSYGAAAATDRALGGLRSGTLIPIFGASFTNNTGVTITSLDISYTGEQWRLGTAGRTDRIDFQISTNATDLSTGTYIDVDALDFTTPNTVTSGAKDGNAAANRTALATSITGLNIASGASFFIRWTDVDATGADDGLSVDDFSITPQGAVVVDNPPTVSSTVPADNAVNIPVNTNVSVTFSEAVTATASSFTISCDTSGAHPFALSGGPTTFTLDPTTDFTGGEVCTVTVVAAQVTDQDAPPDQMAVDYVFDFTIVNSTPLAIHEIQGNGTASPYDGQVVTTTGIVTLLKTTTNNGGAANGFFLQTLDADVDADPNTSQGILVFTSSVPTYTSPPTPVAVGDEVSVTGTVDEFFNMTEISPVLNITVIDTGNPLPTPVTLDTTILDPTAAPDQPQLEKFEGMRMYAESLTAVAPNDNFFDVQTVISSEPRPMREPGIPISLTVPPDPTSGTPDCCVPRWDENPERIILDTNARAGAPLNPYTSLVLFSNVAGPLDFSFSEYRVIPDTGLTATGNLSAVPVPIPSANEFTVAGYNIENFNNAVAQRQKSALTIRDVLRLPDIIGTVEIFDLADLQALAVEVNTIAPGSNYQAYLVEADGTTGDNDQDVGFLVDASRVQVNSVVQRNAAETYINPINGLPELLNDRPPLVLNANVEPGTANVPVIVIVNHLRSFIDIDQDPGDGPRVRAKRKAQAESLATLFQEYQTNNPTTSVISVGDYNAYQFNDGYTDPIAVLKCDPTPDDQVVVDESPMIVDPDFINLVDFLPFEEQYSFIFEGTPQALDHVLINSVAAARTTGMVFARVNADFPENPAATYLNNATRPERNSDHDPAVAYFSLNTLLAGQVIISEYRTSGPNGDEDEFIELYNAGFTDITVTDALTGTGWALVSGDDTTTPKAVVPNGTVIPARGHYLIANDTAVTGYSLSDYGGVGAAAPDLTFTTNIPQNRGVALFASSTVGAFTSVNLLDAVGSVAETDALYREGAGHAFIVLSATDIDGVNVEYTFFRDLRSGTPKDTGDNAADFLFADTQALSVGAGQRLGAPGPENLGSPLHNFTGGLAITKMDGSVGADAAPNFEYDNTPIINGGSGSIRVRRTIINNTGSAITRLRFRIVDITTFPVPPGTADLRSLTSAGGTFGAFTVQGLTLEEPPTQINGGGWNSSLLSQPITDGQSINVEFLFGIQQQGCFRFVVIAEASPGGADSIFGFAGTAGSGTCGPTAAPATISGNVVTPDGAPLGGVTMRLAGAKSATTITDAGGNYRFQNVDTEQFYIVTPARVNYNFNPGNHSFSLLGNKSDAVFTAIPETAIVGNAIDSAEYFVRQHYLDFLGREPDESGFNFWSQQIASCGADAGCLERKRINVSAAYFLSIEFQQTGGLVDRLYRASFGRRPFYAEFLPDAQTVAQGVVVGNSDWAERLRTNKRAFVAAFVNRAAFRAAYDGLSNAGYVDTLISQTRVSFNAGERDAWVSALHSGASTRAEVLGQIAEHDGFVKAKRNETFVMMQYFGYLRRDPDESGYEFWLTKLNQFNGNFEQAEMVKAFINSGEYRARFSR